MIRLKPNIPTYGPSQPEVVVVFNELEKNILIRLLHDPVLDSVEVRNRLGTLAIRRYREMAHELER